jgi:hypothetical protein
MQPGDAGQIVISSNAVWRESSGGQKWRGTRIRLFPDRPHDQRLHATRATAGFDWMASSRIPFEGLEEQPAGSCSMSYNHG